MIHTYKIGKEYMCKSADKNSALFEYNMIKEITREYPGSKNILLVIGGLATKEDIEYIKKLINNKQFDKTVFVMTDTGSLKYIDLINEFDLVLHQAVNDIDSIKVKQMYGYMPELFYEEKVDVQVKSNVVLFGGNNLNRDKELHDICFTGNKVNDGFLLLLKNYEAGTDYRIPHSAYMQILAQCKFSLVFSSGWVYKHNWITARLIEAYSVNNIPLVSKLYDNKNWYEHSVGRIRSYKDIKEVLEEKYDKELHDYLEFNRRLARNRKNMFKEILYNM